ncbi:MAG: glycosyltransferase family 1 protein [Chloroflexi bacterium]|nr:glycosyltransferase family 1 protein [Chloroflexota bacterium]
MKIVVATIGSRGDVQPYINLCQGLQEAGHEVVLATNPTLYSLATSHGVTSVPVGPPVDMGAVGARLMDQSFNNMWIGMIRVMQFGARLVEEAYPDVLKVCQGADLVITSDTGSGIAEADKLNIPWISVTLQPARIPVTNATPSFLGRVIWAVMGKLFIAPTNRFRKRVGAPPVKDITSMMSTRQILLPVSQHVASPDPRWPRHVYQTGYWFARPQKEWEPPRDLLDFLEGGDKPIAVSLGVMGMSGKRARQGAQIILGALERTNVRAIIQGWDEVLHGLEIPKTVYHAGALPHSWLFDQVSMVIHHGGFGTTAATLRAGVPSIVVPHVIDQFYWGQRVNELGVSPGFISRGKLSVENLSEAIMRVKNDGQIQEKAGELGYKIRTETDGVTTAVQAIKKIP